ncbi:B12-binding domain-containing radical SAM protein [Thermodesulfobacteriota bacterium]
MRITLIRYHDKGNINTRLPQSLNRVQGHLPPLGIAYVAATLERAGFSVSIIDAPAMNYTRDDVLTLLKKDQPTLVGVTTMTSSFHGALEACSLAKEAGATVLIGGVHLEIYPEQSLYYDVVDYGIVGEGEESFVKLAEALRDGSDVSTIPGIAFKKDGRVVVNGCVLVSNLDSLPMPSRHLLPNNRYSSIIGLHPVTTMIASRGCPYHCGFCFKQAADKKVRFRSAKSVVDEMAHVVEKYGVKEIMFYDDTLTMNRQFVTDLCEDILSRGLTVKWEAPSRIDTVDREMLTLMKRANCIRLRFGVESGNPRILKLMNKKITLDQVREVFSITRKLGIETFAYFIIGYITETEETIKETIAFAKSLKADLFMFTVATPYPGTPLYTLARELGFIKGDYWEDLTLGRNTERLPFFVDNADKWVKRAYRSFYFDPLFVLKKLRSVRSFDQIKKMLSAAGGLLFFKMSDKD